MLAPALLNIPDQVIPVCGQGIQQQSEERRMPATNATGVMVTGEPVAGLVGLEAYWNKIQGLIGPGGSYQVKVNVDKSDLYGDLAVSSGTTDDTVRLASGKELRFNSLWTTISRKENGEWKLIRLQATMDPVENVFISMRLNPNSEVGG